MDDQTNFFLRKKYHRSLNRCRRHENSETLNKSGRSNSIKQQQLPRQLPFSQMEISDDREMFTDWRWRVWLSAGPVRVPLKFTTDRNTYPFFFSVFNSWMVKLVWCLLMMALHGTGDTAITVFKSQSAEVYVSGRRRGPEAFRIIMDVYLQLTYCIFSCSDKTSCLSCMCFALMWRTAGTETH